MSVLALPCTFVAPLRAWASKVCAGVPFVLNPMADDQMPNRLGLASWLVWEDNPLTARVAVNRFWEQLFGHGIVETSEDFGTQGAPPTHPELLDWLATEFPRDGWSMKKMLRLMVTSATYPCAHCMATLPRINRPVLSQSSFSRRGAPAAPSLASARCACIM